ncbi:hypothetical protein BDV19DRAFT_359684 [Aspergillus venezuelensis]
MAILMALNEILALHVPQTSLATTIPFDLDKVLECFIRILFLPHTLESQVDYTLLRIRCSLYRIHWNQETRSRPQNRPLNRQVASILRSL